MLPADADDQTAPPPWLRRAVGQVAAAVLVLVAVAWGVSRLYHLVLLAVASMFLAFALEPTVDRLEARGWRRGLATGLVFLVAVVAAAGFTAVVAYLLAQEAPSLGRLAPRYLDDVQGWLDRHNVDVGLDRLRASFGPSAASTAVSAGSQALGVLAKAATVLFFSFYLVADGPRVRRAVCRVLPPARQERLLEVLETAIDKTGAYLTSRLILAAVSVVVHSVAFVAMGVPYGALVGAWFGVVAQALPVFGTYLGAAAPIAMALTRSPGLAVATLVVCIVYQQVEAYVLAPRVQARAMDVHPAVALASVLAGASLGGFTGVLLALPAAATVQAFASTYAHRYELVSHTLVDTGPADAARDDAEGDDDQGS